MKILFLIKKHIWEITLFLGILLILVMQMRGAGLFGDFSQFYYSGYYYFHQIDKTYSFGSLMELFIQHQELNNLSEDTLPYAFRYFSPPNTTPLLYVLLFPLFFIKYAYAVYIFMFIGLFLSILSTYLFCKKYDIDFKIMLFLFLFSFATLTNIQISQVGNYIYSLVLFIFIVDKKWIKYVLIACLINLKIFFGLILIYYFIQKQYRHMFIIALLTIVIALLTFRFDVSLMLSYANVLNLNLPIKISYNQSIWGLISIFSNNMLIFNTCSVLIMIGLIHLIKIQNNELTIILIALLINPLSLIYYNCLYLIGIMFIYKYRQPLYAVLLYILINIPIQLTTYQDVNVLNLMPIWYILSIFLHYIGMILIIKNIYNMNKYSKNGTDHPSFHILSFM